MRNLRISQKITFAISKKNTLKLQRRLEKKKKSGVLLLKMASLEVLTKFLMELEISHNMKAQLGLLLLQVHMILILKRFVQSQAAVTAVPSLSRFVDPALSENVLSATSLNQFSMQSRRTSYVIIRPSLYGLPPWTNIRKRQQNKLKHYLLNCLASMKEV